MTIGINLMGWRTGKVDIETELAPFLDFLAGYASGFDAASAQWDLPRAGISSDFMETIARWKKCHETWPSRYLEFGCSDGVESLLLDAYDAWREARGEPS